MHYLIRQFLQDFRQGSGRRHRIQVNKFSNKLRYTAPNGILFIIDCSDSGTREAPVIISPEAEPYGTSHATHTLGDGRVCLASSISGWELDRILLYCDSWAKGIRIYQRGKGFPKNPRASFSTR